MIKSIWFSFAQYSFLSDSRNNVDVPKDTSNGRVDALSSLDRSISNASGALYIGADTLIQLDLQRHALERGEEQLAAMDNDLTRSEWLLHGMKSIWGSGTVYIFIYTS